MRHSSFVLLSLLIGTLLLAEASQRLRGDVPFYQDPTFDAEVLAAISYSPSASTHHANTPISKDAPVTFDQSSPSFVDVGEEALQHEAARHRARRTAGNRHADFAGARASRLQRAAHNGRMMRSREAPSFDRNEHNNGFYSFLESTNTGRAKTQDSAAASVTADDPFGGSSPFSGNDISPPIQTSHALSAPHRYDAPAFTEVMSQIREIVDSAPSRMSGNTKISRSPDDMLRNVIGQITSAPSEAPPGSPPPIPMADEGPPSPVLMETQPVSWSQHFSASHQPSKTLETGFISIDSSVRPHVEHEVAAPALAHSAPAPASNAPHRNFKIELAPELLETQSKVTKHEAPRDPNAMPLFNAKSEARAFIEEMAGMRTHHGVLQHTASVPPPAVKRHDSDHVFHKFRQFD